MTGILLMDKPRDWTSHDVVAKLRGLLRERRIGHAGTLDPLATGLLTIFVGRATRAVEFAEVQEKTYIARLRLGLVTDTQDITGRILHTCDTPVSRGELEAVLPRFLGEIQQTPPMYSAIKVDGQRLYKLARKGMEVERKARPVTIRRLDILAEGPDGFDLEITCSKGTYIRTLCHDMGQMLGVGGVMTALQRTHVGAFSLQEAHTLAEIEAEADDRSRFLRPVDTLFASHPALALNAIQEQKLRNGQTIRLTTDAPGPVRVYSQTGEFLALGEVTNRSGLELRVKKSFFMPADSRAGKS
ncbi:MAG: tRNA pseudouridine(55) synthase TruB [Oscillospiraceae bacterium]|nr:tRNA pseudouridine(55) synthase TruB [Oscillospiraceae bacterium]